MRQWDVKSLIVELSKLPPTAQVFLEDTDTYWIIDKFEVAFGHAKNDDHTSEKSILLRPSHYGDINSNLEFKVDR